MGNSEQFNEKRKIALEARERLAPTLRLYEKKLKAPSKKSKKTEVEIMNHRKYSARLLIFRIKKII